MNGIINLIAMANVWLGMTWMFYKYLTDERFMNHPILRKMFFGCIACMVLAGALLVRAVDHIWD